MDTALVSTKLKRPPLTSDLVTRPRLVARLDAHPECGLILISAPAGYGKTTLLCEWLQSKDESGKTKDEPTDAILHRQSPAIASPFIGSRQRLHHPSRIAWVSLDEHDNRLDLFLRYVVAALRGQFPGKFAELRALLTAPRLGDIETLVTALVNQIDELERRVILVLDDFHLMSSDGIIQFLSLLVKNLPPNLQLVLSTRADPLLPLARARAQGNLIELRAADLRFTKDEVARFVRQTTKTEVDAKTLELLDRRVLGWAVGLRLATLSHQGERELANLNVTISGTERLMSEFLTDQVLVRLPKAVQTFLLRTSFLDRFCVSLCDALLDSAPVESASDSAGAILEHVQHANLFLMPLDSSGTWFRYHPLFQELLQQRLAQEMSAAQIEALHRRASEWFQANAFPEDALRHARLARDPALAARVLETNAHAYFNREDWRTVERWLSQIPAETIAARPLLQLAQAWIWFQSWKLEAIPPLLDGIEKNLERGEFEQETEHAVRSGVYTLRAHLTFWRADAEACFRWTRLALELAPVTYRFLRGTAWFYYLASLQAQGKKREAFLEVDRALEQDGAQLDQFTTRVLYGKAFASFLEDDLYESLQASAEVARLSTQSNLWDSAAWAYNAAARVHYEWHELHEAAKQFSKTVALRHNANPRTIYNAYHGLALTYQALGRRAQADQMAQHARTYALEMRLPKLLRTSNAFDARLALLRGDVETAVRSASSIPLEFTPNIFIMLEVPELTKLAVLIAEASPASLQAAGQWHAVLADFCARTHNEYHSVTLLALQALLQAARGRRADALNTMHAVIQCARGARRIRTFVDLGKPMANLLQALARDHRDDPYLNQLLVAFEPVPLLSPYSEHEGAPNPLVEALTRRERQVLESMRTPLSVKEIANQLNISPLTAQRHMANIYAKLGTNNRRAAVAAALEMGILSPA